MLDFNSKKEILGRLRRKGQKNFLMFVPCAIAAFFVKAWYALVCRADMALSDKNGDLLGIKGLGKKEKNRSRKDDIVYVRKPFWGRFTSAVLALSLTLMLMPTINGGLNINVKAATPTPSVGYDVKYNGEIETFYEDVSRETVSSSGERLHYLYRAKDFDAAVADKIDGNIEYIAGYEGIKITWEYNHDLSTGLNKCNLKGFSIALYTKTGKVVKSPQFYENPLLREMIYTDLGTQEEVYAVIYPKVGVPTFIWTGSLVSNKDGGVNEDGDKLNPTNNVNEDYIVDAQSVGNLNNSVPLNARFDPPVIEVNNGLIDNKDGSIYIKWNKATQIGGNYEGAQADGYIIYRADGENGSYKPITPSPLPADQLDYTDNVAPGFHYRYFVEAYRSLPGWGRGTYDPSDKGMISSSAGSVSADADTKARTVYSKVIKDVYVAPLMPSIKVTANKNSNRIDIQCDPIDGSYSGVFLYRTEGPIELTALSEGVVLGDMSFGEWMHENGSKSNNPFGITTVGSGFFSGEHITCEDTDIVEGQTYWYYAVSFLTKINSGNLRLYSSDVASASSKLQLDLDAPVAITPVKSDGQTTISWDAVEGAQGYELEYTLIECYQHGTNDEECPHDIGKATTVTIKNGTSYTHERLYNNDKYKYKVRAIINIQSVDKDGKLQSKKYGDWSPEITVTVGTPIDAPLNVSATTVDGEITVTWDAVDGADAYILRWVNTTKGTRGDIEGIKGRSYRHTNLLNDDRYVYTVMAIKTIEGDSTHEQPQKIPSDWSGAYALKVGQGLNVPQDLKATTKDGETTVTWSDVDGAEGYILQYRRPGQAWADYTDHTDLHNIDLSDPSFNHTRLYNGDVYEYRVIAYKTVSGERVYSEPSIVVSITVGDILNAPKDFAVVTTDGTANLTWTASAGAEGYIVYAYSSKDRRMYSYDVSKNQFSHTNLINGDNWIYYVVAYKTVNGERTYSSPTNSISVNIGVSMTAAVDLTATPGNRQVVLNWSEVTGAQGYVVYLYNEVTMEYEPITVTSQTTYTHLGLKNGKSYRYMVAAYKDIGGERVYGEYSMPVTAIPTTGSLTDIDRELTIKGTAPYGISHGEYISASANHGAFDESVDVYFTTSTESTKTVREVLRSYAGGLNSFIIYPFDISVYSENTMVELPPNDGYNVTITMPIPDRLIAYRDYITVVHINEYADEESIEEDDDVLVSTERRLEVLPSAVLDIDNVWCVQFNTSSFSPYALVIYKEHISDVASGGGNVGGLFAGSFNSGVLLFTALPDIMPNNNKLRIVSGGKKRYRIKNIEKISK